MESRFNWTAFSENHPQVVSKDTSTTFLCPVDEKNDTRTCCGCLEHRTDPVEIHQAERISEVSRGTYRYRKIIRVITRIKKCTLRKRSHESLSLILGLPRHLRPRKLFTTQCWQFPSGSWQQVQSFKQFSGKRCRPPLTIVTKHVTSYHTSFAVRCQICHSPRCLPFPIGTSGTFHVHTWELFSFPNIFFWKSFIQRRENWLKMPCVNQSKSKSHFACLFGAPATQSLRLSVLFSVYKTSNILWIIHQASSHWACAKWHWIELIQRHRRERNEA